MSKKSLKDIVNEELANATDAYHEVEDELHPFSEEFEPPPNPASGLYIFNKNDIVTAEKHEYNRTRKDILKALYRENNWKPYAVIQPGLYAALDALGKQFANFEEVTALCKRSLQLFSLESPKIIRFPPMLLSGPPGVGKTRFMEELAKTLGTAFYALDFSTLSSGFIVAGGSSSWSEAKPGFISDSIRKSQHANPIIMLDEIDKVVADSRFDPLGAFYSLLETHTAKRFVDEYLDVPMNLSAVLWVASANYPERIPAPIRSRMIEVHIKPPTKSQSRVIVKAIYRELLEKYSWGKHFSVELDPKIIDRLSALSPRLVRIELEKSLAHAVSRSGGKLKPIVLIPSDVRAQKAERKPGGIGFLANIH